LDKQCERCEAELKTTKRENCSKGLYEIDVLEEEDKPEVFIEENDKTSEKELGILLVS